MVVCGVWRKYRHQNQGVVARRVRGIDVKNYAKITEKMPILRGFCNIIKSTHSEHML